MDQTLHRNVACRIIFFMSAFVLIHFHFVSPLLLVQRLFVVSLNASEVSVYNICLFPPQSFWINLMCSTSDTEDSYVLVCVTVLYEGFLLSQKRELRIPHFFSMLGVSHAPCDMVTRQLYRCESLTSCLPTANLSLTFAMTMICITISSPKTSHIQHTRVLSPTYQYVVNLVVSLAIRGGPGVFMNVPVR